MPNRANLVLHGLRSADLHDMIWNKKRMHVNFFAAFMASLNDVNLSLFSLSYNFGEIFNSLERFQIKTAT